MSFLLEQVILQHYGVVEIIVKIVILTHIATLNSWPGLN